MQDPFQQPMPYHDRRARREAPHGFEGIWKAVAWCVLGWIVVFALGHGAAALINRLVP